MTDWQGCMADQPSRNDPVIKGDQGDAGDLFHAADLEDQPLLDRDARVNGMLLGCGVVCQTDVRLPRSDVV